MLTDGVSAVIVSNVEFVAGGEILTTLPATHEPPPVGQKNTCAGNWGLLDAFQNPVPWMVMVVFPIVEPALVPTRPVTVGVTAL